MALETSSAFGGYDPSHVVVEAPASLADSASAEELTGLAARLFNGSHFDSSEAVVGKRSATIGCAEEGCIIASRKIHGSGYVDAVRAIHDHYSPQARVGEVISDERLGIAGFTYEFDSKEGAR